MCGRPGAGLDWPEEKDNFSNNIDILLIFAIAAKMVSSEHCCQSTNSGTSSLTFCQISGLNKAFEKIIKYQTALKFEFQEHASDWPEDCSHPTMLIFPVTAICAELYTYICCQSTWGHLSQLYAMFKPWMKHHILSVLDSNSILKI